MVILTAFLSPSVKASDDAIAKVSPVLKRGGQSAFFPEKPWVDTDGGIIDCHGGGILHMNGKYYWFGEHRGWEDRLAAVSVYSSENLYNWKREGVALTRSKDTQSDLAPRSVVERPKVLWNSKTGKYVMWFHLELAGQGYSAARAAVAVSDSVTGPYKYLNSFRPNGNMSRDMNLYQDEDGKAYQIYSARENYDLRICQLSDDFLSATTNDVMVSSDHREAPALFKHQGTYFLITSECTGWEPNKANYYTAPKMAGPWTVHTNPCRGQFSATTFGGQSTFVLPVPGKEGAFIFMADRWVPRDIKKSGHIWLPISIHQNEMSVEWRDSWDLSWFERQTN